MDITKDIKKHLNLSFIKGDYNKQLLHKLLLIKSLEICNLAEENESFGLSMNKYKILDLLNKLN